MPASVSPSGLPSLHRKSALSPGSKIRGIFFDGRLSLFGIASSAKRHAKGDTYSDTHGNPSCDVTHGHPDRRSQRCSYGDAESK